MTLKAVIFDLDGVITDTAEYHYRSWKRMTEEEGLPFDRTVNEELRGISRRESLRIILGERQLPEEEMLALMTRKNNYYIEMLDQVTADDLLPGVEALLDELNAAGIPCAIASSSRNATRVIKRLGIGDRLALIADGNSVKRAKPAPDLFRFAAAQLNVPPGQCLVVEDAAAGIEAAVAAGMWALALGPADRFDTLLAERDGRIAHRHSLRDVSLADLQAMATADKTWVVTQDEFIPAAQHHMETVFTLGNGYFATRGAFEEGYPDDMPITFAHGVFDDLPTLFTELANLPNWLDCVIHVDGHPLRLDKGTVLHFARQMDLRQAILRREVRWQAPGGAIVDLTFERFASYTEEHLGALRVLATAVNRPCDIRIETGVNGHVSNEDYLHWNHPEQGASADNVLWLHSRTRHSEIDLATAVTVQVEAETAVGADFCPAQPRFVLEQSLDVAQTCQVDKLIAYTAGRDDVPGAADVVGRAVALLDGRDYDTLRLAHIHAWQQLWRTSDVVIEGDDEAQLAVRFSLFQLLVAAPQHDHRVSIGAKTLSGFGYRGHVFWDTEIFVLPFFTFTQPHIARNLLRYRYHTLEGARRKAAKNGYRGAQFAWESATTGDEVTPMWVPHFSEPEQLVRIWTGDIEIHISADVAYAINQYWQATGDDIFMCKYGAEIILDTARFWGDRAELERKNGRHCYAFRDVIGPDEYHDHVDNNAFTNRMAQWHLQKALEVWHWLRRTFPEKAQALQNKLSLSEELFAHWQDVIDHVIIHQDPETGLITQFEGFFERNPVDPADIATADKSMQVILGIEGANESQVIKQADVIMLLCLLRDEYDKQTWQTNWDTYMPITDHQFGSSLGPSFHAWAACEMNKPDEAYRHFMLAARADLRDVRGNAGEGIHAASAGGIWQAAVFGFGGLRLTENGFKVAPRLPSHWHRLAFNFYRHQELKSVNITVEGGEVKTKVG